MDPQLLSPAANAKRLRALVVDDVAVNRHILRSFLNAEGIAVSEVASAAEALLALERSGFDLVVLDLELEPGADGFLVLDVIRRRRELDLMPVVLVSGHHVDSPSVERGLLAGADDYVTRPVAPEVLRARILSAVRSRARVLGLHREATRAARSAATALELLREASEVQRATLPSVPLKIARASVSGAVIPANAVAGDAFDVVVDRHGALSICLLDAAGHGPASGLVVSASRQVVRSALELGLSLPEVGAELGRCLSGHVGCVEAAVALGIVRFAPEGNHVDVLNAGLPPIVRYCPETGHELFRSGSLPVGLSATSVLQSRAIVAPPRSTWLVASDGITGGEMDDAAMLAVAKRVGIEANGRALSRSEAHLLEQLVGELVDAAPEARDDATMVIAHVENSR